MYQYITPRQAKRILDDIGRPYPMERGTSWYLASGARLSKDRFGHGEYMLSGTLFEMRNIPARYKIKIHANT